MLELCEALHHHMMHPGVKKQALDMQRRFEFDQIGLYSAGQKGLLGLSGLQSRQPECQGWPWKSSPCPKFT